MIQFSTLMKQQVLRHLDVSETEFEYLTHPNPSHLHDPLYYKDMRELVSCLRRFRLEQEKDPTMLLVVDGDYDTDGICASTILNASLSVFGFRYALHVPTMAEGYGLSPNVIKDIEGKFNTVTTKVKLILTADNGISAHAGVSYAKERGITVLITDHHPGSERVPKAFAVVDPHRPDDRYPFSGNSGACVAWKAMLAYAQLFERDKLPLIEQLIVFAGISNVGDVMPMRGENRWTVVAAMRTLLDMMQKPAEDVIPNTPYDVYDTAFAGLYDLVRMLQDAKDEKRRREGKGPIPLPQNEELISWYLSPLLNAPRRVHDTCLEALAAFTVTDPEIRRTCIRRLMELNDEKSRLRDKMLAALPENPPLVSVVNTKKGISGLIAGKIAGEQGQPCLVFSVDRPEDATMVYEEPPKGVQLSGSARSNALYPLKHIVAKINEKQPGIVSGGGHATAGGYRIWSNDYARFVGLFEEAAAETYREMMEHQLVTEVPANEVVLCVTRNTPFTALYQVMDGEGTVTTSGEDINSRTFAHDVKETADFIGSLRPFGDGYMDKPQIRLVFDETVKSYKWNPSFWKTFKFDLFGVEVLTFDETLADEVKEKLKRGETVTCIGALKVNEFRGRKTPQIILSRK